MELTLDNEPKSSHDAWEEYRQEINRYYEILKHLNQIEPIELFQSLSAISARVSEMRTRCFRVDSVRSKSFRVQEVEPLLEEVDRQFKIHSRIITYHEFEWKISGERGRT